MADKDLYQAELFSNRLAKRYRLLRKWARKNRVTCYRLYDRDIPEIPLAADIYEFLPDDITSPIEAARFMQQESAAESANDASSAADRKSRQYLTLSLYERPYEKPEAEEEAWLAAMAKAADSVLSISIPHIIIKTRKHDKGGSQYAKDDLKIVSKSDAAISGTVQELGQLFRVDLSNYLDTGLFFDHRPLRSIVRDTSSGKSVLNLYCYTASFSVYAAEGKAKRVESVDLSNTYLAWAEQNMKMNGFDDAERYICTRGDVTGFLNQKNAEVPHLDAKGKIDGTNRWDIIILDPPTFSNSKMTENTLDINRDWPELVNKCVNLLTPGGTLYFSTNSRRLSFDSTLINGKSSAGYAVHTEDITAQTLDEDYKDSHAHRCWKISTASVF